MVLNGNCSNLRTHLFTKILGEKLGYDEEYENAVVGIWMLDKEVDMWGIELTWKHHILSGISNLRNGWTLTT
jgi:hypothetical protein